MSGDISRPGAGVQPAGLIKGTPDVRVPMLIVDDHRETLDSLRRLLQEDVEVVIAGPDHAYERAVELWESRPDLLVAIVDLRLPKPGGGAGDQLGFELALRLKEREGARVAIHTAYGTSTNAETALALGLDAFIRKDTPAERVLEVVYDLLRYAGRPDPAPSG